MNHSISFLTIVLALLAFPSSQAVAGEGNLELYGGYYLIDQSEAGDDFIYGLRGGYRFSDSWGLQANVSLLNIELEEEIPMVDVDVDVTFVEVSALWFVNPGKQAEFFLYGGIGDASIDVNVDVDAGGDPVEVDVDDSLFAYHLGAGVQVALGERTYLRPDLRARAFDDRSSEVDFELSLAIGWRFGR